MGAHLYPLFSIPWLLCLLVWNNVDCVAGDILREDLARILQRHVDGAKRSHGATGNLFGDVHLLNDESSVINMLLNLDLQLVSFFRRFSCIYR